MQVLLLLLASLLSGVIAGMGMGGGTVLIPILSLCFGVEQLICQSTNVACFIILAILCFVIYIKNKMIDYFALVSIAIPASVVSFFLSFFAVKISSKILKICFAVFIILVGIFYLTNSIILLKNKRK